MRIAMVGTRGVPAAYGGFETAVEEIGQRLVAAGHEVTVYCRRNHGAGTPKTYLGMDLVYLPALRLKALETLSHTAFTSVKMLLSRRFDAAFVFNAANAPFLPLIGARRVPIAVHVDGLEWKRGKWGVLGRKYYRAAEQMAVRRADALIADARGIADYYADEFGIATDLITYGAPLVSDRSSDRVTEIGLNPNGYHLVVARFEPENHVDVIIDGYASSGARLPLVVVGSAPYAAEYTEKLFRTAYSDPRIRMLGGIWDQEQLTQLYANARTYVHGHSVGGTNPSLLRAMGAGTAVLGWDVVFNREVLGVDGRFFRSSRSAAELIEEAESDAVGTTRSGDALRERAAEHYDWDQVADQYEDLAIRLASGRTTRGASNGRRNQSAWNDESVAISVPEGTPA